MRGRRAPEMAAGGFFLQYERVAGRGLVDLLGSLSVRLPPAQRAILVQDYERASDHLMFVLAVRLAHWEEPPWSLCAIAHHSRELSVAALEFELHRHSNHPKVRYLQNELWDDAHGFLAGAELRMLPRLADFFAEFLFIPTVERAIEGEHATACV